MVADLREHAWAVFDRLADVPPEERAAALAAACGDDAVLQAEVNKLLAVDARLTANEGEQPFLQTPLIRPLSGSGGAAADLSFLAPPSEPGALGRLDQYEILEVIGRGGMGMVLRARDSKLLRVVAIKVLAASLAASSTARQRFLREARAAAAVRDDHVVAIHAVCDDAPVPYLVMEFIDGCSLEAHLRCGGPLEIKEVLRIGIQIAVGLAAAHQHGLIHRDVKPANILLENPLQRVKLTDFGLARAADNARLTQSGLIAGTPLYMAPEQAADEPIDARADLFSLGSVLYELCTGQAAFQAVTTVAVIRRVCDEAPRRIRELNPDAPEPLCRLIDRLHAKKPTDRPATAKEVADVLARLLEDLQGGSCRLPDDLGGMLSRPLADDRESPGRKGAAKPWHASGTVSEPAASPRRTVLSRRWLRAAAALVLLCAGLGLGEASGVIHVRGAVSRLFSRQGTPIAEVDERKSKQAARLAEAEAWEKSVADLPPEKQVEAVERRLRKLNPEFRGKVDFDIRDGKVVWMGFLSDWVTDISPLRALKGLESLDCGGSQVRKGRLADLTPLRGLRLRRLKCTETQVSDLMPLRDMPLQYLHCGGTKVESLSPLEGMKLISLTIQETLVRDLQPLRGMPLKYLDLCGAREAWDLVQLDGMPLEYLNVSELPLGTLDRLSSMTNLQTLILDGTPITDLGPLRSLRLKKISLLGTAVTDLTPLKGMPLNSLRLDYRPELEAFVRSFPELQLINEKPTAMFWKEVAGK